MRLTGGSTTLETDGVATTDQLPTYNEEEKQQNEINASNASLIFQPAFIPVFPSIQKQFGLTDTEAKLYGFIWFYLANGAKRFYFTNEQLADVTNCYPSSVSKAMKTLEVKGLIKTSRRMRANGGLIRFVEGCLTSNLQIAKLAIRELPKKQRNNNKINKNKINSYEIPETSSGSGESTSSNKQQLYRSLITYCRQKQNLDREFINYVKQTTAVKKILLAGYTEDDIRFVIDQMVNDPYWKDNPFDMMSVANKMHYFMNRTITFKKGGVYRAAI